MTETRNETRCFEQNFSQLSAADKAVFKTILELAIILLKPQYPTTEPKKEET